MHDINLGAAIARERRAAQVTQGELAAHLGVTKAAVSKWELEQSMPDVALLPRIAAYFDLTLDELFDYRPQLVGDNLQGAYLRLLAQFDEDPEAAFANAEDLVRSHYSCWPALQQMGMLYVQRATLDPDRAEPYKYVILGHGIAKLWPHAPQSCSSASSGMPTMWSLCAPRG